MNPAASDQPEPKENPKMIAIKKFNSPAAPKTQVFEVIHPLYDVQEQKMTGENLGKMKLSKGTKFILLGLRIYLIVMGTMLIYHVLDMAGLFGHAAK